MRSAGGNGGCGRGGLPLPCLWNDGGGGRSGLSGLIGCSAGLSGGGPCGRLGGGKLGRSCRGLLGFSLISGFSGTAGLSTLRGRPGMGGFSWFILSTGGEISSCGAEFSLDVMTGFSGGRGAGPVGRSGTEGGRGAGGFLVGRLAILGLAEPTGDLQVNRTLLTSAQ